MEPVIVAEWPRNAREAVRISLSKYNGAPMIDMRVWYDDGAGKTRPAKQGLTLSTKYLPRLAGALTKALADAEARGLVPADAPRPHLD